MKRIEGQKTINIPGKEPEPSALAPLPYIYEASFLAEDEASSLFDLR